MNAINIDFAVLFPPFYQTVQALVHKTLLEHLKQRCKGLANKLNYSSTE